MTAFDVTPTVEAGEVSLSGVVETAHGKQVVVQSVETALGTPATADDVRVLAGTAEQITPTGAEIAVRGTPDEDGERVTSVVYGMALSGFDRRGGWRRVRTPDGYLGWIRGVATRPAESIAAAVTLARDVPLEGALGWLPAGVPAAVADREDDRITLAFRTGVERDIPAGAVGPTDGPLEPQAVVSTARNYLGTGYRWGGMTTDGIDCSGLVWMAFWQQGLGLPRDADQQRRLGVEVDRADLEPGDLLFFPGHVAISLGGTEFVHADGGADEVHVQSLDPGDDRYAPDRDDTFEVAKRLLR